MPISDMGKAPVAWLWLGDDMKAFYDKTTAYVFNTVLMLCVRFFFFVLLSPALFCIAGCSTSAVRYMRFSNCHGEVTSNQIQKATKIQTGTSRTSPFSSPSPHYILYWFPILSR